MKRTYTYEGKLTEEQGCFWIGPKGSTLQENVSLPIRHFLGQEVRLTIEVEPISLKDRVEKIFEQRDFVTLDIPYPSGVVHEIINVLKRRVLAEIEKP